MLAFRRSSLDTEFHSGDTNRVGQQDHYVGENSPEWNRALHLGGVRIGCSDVTASCADYAQKIAKSQGVDKIFLSILLSPGRTITDARHYGEPSRTHPVIYEVGFDDFVKQCEKLKLNRDALSSF